MVAALALFWINVHTSEWRGIAINMTKNKAHARVTAEKKKKK